MTPDTVFAKSPKGLEEIETRAHKLGSRLRQVLIRIDGVKSVDELVTEAGDMGEAVEAQIRELERGGFLTDLYGEAPEIEPTVPQAAAAQAPAPPSAPTPAPARVPTPAPAPAAETVTFNSPVKFKLQDLLVDAMGIETGSAGAALNRCRNRDDLARWVDLAVAPIEQAAGKARAKAFHKQAKKLVGG